jgi:hypothetical protein
MLLCVNSMEGGVSLPNIISNESHSARVVFLECPAALGQVGVHLIEEISLEDSIVSLQVLLLSSVLHISKVRVASKVEAVACGQASESFVSLNFVGKG